MASSTQQPSTSTADICCAGTDQRTTTTPERALHKNCHAPATTSAGKVGSPVGPTSARSHPVQTLHSMPSSSRLVLTALSDTSVPPTDPNTINASVEKTPQTIPPVSASSTSSAEQSNGTDTIRQNDHSTPTTTTTHGRSPFGHPSSGSCPVDHANMSKEEIEAFMQQHRRHHDKRDLIQEQPSTPATDSNVHDMAPPNKMYDVYGQEIDPANMMPATPNQLPSPGQKTRLSTERVPSTIPKSGAPDGTTWTYPSPQMFFNALKRKGKADDVDEVDMESVVAIHNRMNERTWRHVLEWEHRFHCHECPNPTLRRFTGKPHDMSPAARFRSTFRGYPKPFDRHDWIVDRCGRQDVRYIIDYYHRENTPGADPIELHVRPALDSPGAVYDRLRFGLAVFKEALLGLPQPHTLEPTQTSSSSTHVLPSTASAAANQNLLPVVNSADLLDENEFKFLTTLTPTKIDEISESVSRDCAKIGQLLDQAENNPSTAKEVNVALNYCMGRVICPAQSEAFMKAMESEPGSEQSAYEGLTACLTRFHVVARRVMLQAAGVKQLGPER